MTYVQYAEPYPGSRGDRFKSMTGRNTPHRGQDTAPGGLPALALARGRVVYTGWSSALGNVVVVEHPDGKFTGYAHLASIAVRVGQEVGRGESVGIIGSTGTAQRGRHLHYTLGNDKMGIYAGDTEDPLAWIASHSGPETFVEVSGPAPAGTLYSATESDGVPGRVLWVLLQRWAADWGYTGPKDGDPEIATWTAVQKALAADGSGYTGIIDGKPGKLTYAALQRWARQGGYTGPDDGDPGPATWRAVAKVLNTVYATKNA